MSRRPPLSGAPGDGKRQGRVSPDPRDHQLSKRERRSKRRYTEEELQAAHYLHGKGITLKEIADRFDRPRYALSACLKRRFGEAHTKLVKAVFQAPLTQKRFSEARKGHPPPRTAFAPGNVPWIKGRKASAATLQKLRQSHLGKALPDRQRAKMSAAHKGRPFTDEHRAKIAKSKRKCVITPDGEFPSLSEAAAYYSVTAGAIHQRMKKWPGWHYAHEVETPDKVRMPRGQHRRGVHWTEEAKARIRASVLAAQYHHTEEARARIGAASSARPRTEQWKSNISQARKGQRPGAATRARVREAQKKRAKRTIE